MSIGVLIGGPRDGTVVTRDRELFWVDEVVDRPISPDDGFEVRRGEYHLCDKYYIWAGWDGHLVDPIMFSVVVMLGALSTEEAVKELQYMASFTDHTIQMRTLKQKYDDNTGKTEYTIWGCV